MQKSRAGLYSAKDWYKGFLQVLECAAENKAKHNAMRATCMVYDNVLRDTDRIQCTRN